VTAASKHIQDVVRHVAEVEHAFLLHGDRHDPVTLPWMPFQAADFVAIMYEVMAETGGDEFLDIGCGPGTKMALASDIFGLNTSGIDIDRQMVEQARSEGLHAYTWDALEFYDYRSYDILWMYRPFRDPEHQDRLEKLVFESMKPGAILAGGAWENHPPASWTPIIDDWELRRGAWVKS